MQVKEMINERDLQEKFFQVYKKQIAIEEFESWIYENDSIEQVIGEERYFQLLSINYKQKHSWEEVEKLISPLIRFDLFEKERVIKLLNNILYEECSLYETMSTLYDDYCHGYSFLRYLGLSYASSETSEYDTKDSIRDNLLSNIEKYQKEAVRLFKLLEKGQIKITDEFKYEDYREEEDRIELYDINKMLNDETITVNNKSKSIIERILKVLKF